MTTTDLQPIPDTARSTSASLLQRLLLELVALTLDLKQAHWNVTGPAFLPVHALTDEIAADARTWADRVGERAMALGFPVDARPRTVAAVASNFPAGPVQNRQAIAKLIGIIDGVTATARRLLVDLERADPVTHDLTIEIVEGLKKYRRMLRAQLAGHPSSAAGIRRGRVPRASSRANSK